MHIEEFPCFLEEIFCFNHSGLPEVCRYGNSCTPRVCRYVDFCVVLRPKGARPPPHSPEGGMKGTGRNERGETRYRCGIFSYFFSFFHFFHFLESPKRPWGEFFIIFFPVLLSRRSDPKATVRSLQRTDQRWPRGGVGLFGGFRCTDYPHPFQGHFFYFPSSLFSLCF